VLNPVKDAVPFALNVAAASHETVMDLSEKISRGLPFPVSPGDFTMVGSPLFDEFNKSGGTVHVRKRVPASIRFGLADSNGQLLCELSEFHGELEGGPAEQRFLCQQEEMPFVILLTFHAQSSGIGGTLDVCWKCDFSSWIGRPLTQLPYLDDLLAFVDGLTEAHSLVISAKLQGNHLFKEMRPLPDAIGDLLRLKPFLDLLSMGRTICRSMKVSAPWLGQISHDEERLVRELYALLTSGRYELDGTYDLSFIYELPIDKKPADLDRDDVMALTGNETEHHLLFGHPIELGPMRYEVTGWASGEQEELENRHYRIHLKEAKVTKCLVRR
jgi:hypothetical protein